MKRRRRPRTDFELARVSSSLEVARSRPLARRIFCALAVSPISLAQAASSYRSTHESFSSRVLRAGFQRRRKKRSTHLDTRAFLRSRHL